MLKVEVNFLSKIESATFNVEYGYELKCQQFKIALLSFRDTTIVVECG